MVSVASFTCTFGHLALNSSTDHRDGHHISSTHVIVFPFPYSWDWDRSFYSMYKSILFVGLNICVFLGIEKCVSLLKIRGRWCSFFVRTCKDHQLIRLTQTTRQILSQAISVNFVIWPHHWLICIWYITVHVPLYVTLTVFIAHICNVHLTNGWCHVS